MNNTNIYNALRRPFTGSRSNIGSKISNSVQAIVQNLKKGNMSKADLTALKECYEAMYSDSSQSLTTIITIFLGILSFNFTLDSLLPTTPRIIINLACFIFCILYYNVKIRTITMENASLRNHIMAINILLAEKA